MSCPKVKPQVKSYKGRRSQEGEARSGIKSPSLCHLKG